MKIGSLNVWAGTEGNELLRFVYEVSAGLDIFCLQEVHRARDQTVPHYVVPKDAGHRPGPINLHLLNELMGPLSHDFDCYFAPAVQALHDCEHTQFNVEYGNVMFVRKSVTVHAYWQGLVHGRRDQLFCPVSQTAAARSGQVLVFEHKDFIIVLGHTHGIWSLGDKTDVPCRMKQMEKLLEVMGRERKQVVEFQPNSTAGTILLGDLNVITSTRTVRDIGRSSVFGYSGCNHLTAFEDTRTGKYPADKKYREADHVFASGNLDTRVDIISEDVPSDHALLVVTI